MNKHVLTIFFSTLLAVSVAQTATDFTAEDCNGTTHNLFSQLDAGKVIVICWVMPCGACVGPAFTTSNVVQSYSATHPNTVIMYLVDDYGNTACSSINSWANTNNLTRTTRFSNSDISMADYGTDGMPKTVVLAGSNHAVLYNSNFTVDPTELQNAINTALTTTGIHDISGIVSAFNLFPNPASKSAEVQFTLLKNALVHVDVYNLEGQLINNAFKGNLVAGKNNISIDVSTYVSGTYLLKLSVDDKSKLLNLVVSR